MALTDKQRRFVDFYLTSLNATEAAKKAGYSSRTAHQMGYENLRKPDIRRAIKQWMETNAPDLKLLKIKALHRIIQIIMTEALEPRQIVNQIRAIEFLFRYAENMPTADLNEEKLSNIEKLLENARLYEKRAANRETH